MTKKKTTSFRYVGTTPRRIWTNHFIKEGEVVEDVADNVAEELRERPDQWVEMTTANKPKEVSDNAN